MKTKRIELTIELTPAVKVRLEEMAKQMNLPPEDPGRVVQQALACYDLMLENESQGGRSLVEDKDGDVHVLTLVRPDDSGGEPGGSSLILPGQLNS